MLEEHRGGGDAKGKDGHRKMARGKMHVCRLDLVQKVGQGIRGERFTCRRAEVML